MSDRNRSNPTLDEAPERWHEEDELDDGTPIAKLGGLWYVLDDDGEPISEGYHNIETDGDGNYKCERGAIVDKINL